MIFKVSLIANNVGSVLPLSYQYQLSSAILKIIGTSDQELASYLHQPGKSEGKPRFNLFTFSDLQDCSTSIHNNRLFILDKRLSFTICFHIPSIGGHFLNGCFLSKSIEIFDKNGGAIFSIENVECVACNLPGSKSEEIITVDMMPISPLAIGYKKVGNRNYEYRSPEDSDYSERLIYGWLEKYRIVYHIDQAVIAQTRNKLNIDVSLLNSFTKRFVKLKDREIHGSDRIIRAYTGFCLRVTAPRILLELALNAGLGLHNTQGFGCMTLINSDGKKSIDKSGMARKIHRRSFH